LAIFRTKYLKKILIPILDGEIHIDIKKAYYGGMVEVYLLHAINVFCYDVNSLFPFIMANEGMPVGQPFYFVGDLNCIDIDLKDKIIFVHAKLKMPYLHKPFLPTKIHKNGVAGVTIYPVGE